MGAAQLIELSRALSERLARLPRPAGADFVYDPTAYAREPHEDYLNKYVAGNKPVLLLGMNPGPWGMAQTGVPFGAVKWARDWLQLSGEIGGPKEWHPKVEVRGWDCPRNEVSGDRLWGLLADIYSTPAKMSRELAVLNYCPLLLLEASGPHRCRNLPMDKARGSDKILQACDEHLAAVLELVKPEVAIGVGAWATAKLRKIASSLTEVGTMLHPSPASPAANRGFADVAAKQLAAHGVSRRT